MVRDIVQAGRKQKDCSCRCNPLRKSENTDQNETAMSILSSLKRMTAKTDPLATAAIDFVVRPRALATVTYFAAGSGGAGSIFRMAAICHSPELLTRIKVVHMWRLVPPASPLRS
jgi:hypothetical protein